MLSTKKGMQQHLSINEMGIESGLESKKELLSDWDKDVNQKVEDFDTFVELQEQAGL